MSGCFMVLASHIRFALTSLILISASQIAVPLPAEAKPRAAEESEAIPRAPEPEPAPAPLPITITEPPSGGPAKPPPTLYPVGRRLKGKCENALDLGRFILEPILITGNAPACGATSCSTTGDPFKLVNLCLDSAISAVDQKFPNEVPECRLALIQELWDRCLVDNFGLTGNDGVILPSE
jgi:hypothetical protein